MTFRPFRDAEDFAKNYPFAPYQFRLLQKIFEVIRRAGATGFIWRGVKGPCSMPSSRLGKPWP